MTGGVGERNSVTAPWPRGGGEMGARIRAHDWAATGIGPVEDWPESLRTAVAIMLATRHPIGIFWGPEFICLYNDAYAAAVGPERDRAGLGVPARTAWPEIYPTIETDLAQVMAGGEPTWIENCLIPIRRHGGVESVVWTYSCGPIPDAVALNGVGGVLTFIAEAALAGTDAPGDEGMTQDRVAQRAAEALRESEERFRQFAEASSDVMWVRDARTLALEYVNPAFERIYGVSRTAFLTGRELEHWAELICPEDRVAALDAIRSVGRGESVTHEFRIARPADGRLRWLQNTDFPLRDVHGRVQRIGGLAKDITDARDLSDRLQLLVAELQHRTRNLISVVRSIADRTLADSVSLEAFQEHFRRRLGALARVNGLLSRLNEGDRIAFDELLLAELAAHSAVDEASRSPQVTLVGPRGIPLRSATVQTFALALHELATNALKHGALSRPEGRLRVQWKVIRGEAGAPLLRMEWTESGVPAPPEDPPAHTGYGRELIERALPYQLDAETSYEIGPDGVRCTITLPVSIRYAGPS